MANTRAPDGKVVVPWETIPDVPMRAPGRGEKAIAVERLSQDQAAIIQQQAAQIQELQTMVQQQAAQIEQLEATVGTAMQQIGGVWNTVVRNSNHMGLPV